jgi:3-deoxy-D-arabino-heptulosonate 7-phosphate (DAHP) synthase
VIGMSLTKDINERLDEILAIRKELKRMDTDLSEDQMLDTIHDNKQINKQQAISIVEEMIDRVKNDLNKITNNGKNVKGLFTNIYYVNDLMQDKQIVKQEERSKPTCDDEDVEYIAWDEDLPF